MAYDEKLAKRVRDYLQGRHGTSEKRMFGGLSFIVDGNMCVGILGDRLMVRVGADGYDHALAEPQVKPMDFTGRPLRGFVYVDPEGFKTEDSLMKWIDRGLQVASSLKSK